MYRWVASGTLALSLGLAALGEPQSALASETRADAERVIDQVQSRIGDIQRHAAAVVASTVSPEERIAAGDILLRNRDWERAIQTFCQVKELYAQGKALEPAMVDAEFLLGEAYIRSEQYLSARREFMGIVKNGSRKPYDAYAGRAVSRLVDLTLRSGAVDGLDAIDLLLPTLAATDATGSMPVSYTHLR